MTSLRRAILIILVLTPAFSFAQEIQPNQISQTEEAEDSPQNGNHASELNMDELRSRILGEAPNELMRHSLGDSSVSLFMSGFWKGELQGNGGFSKSDLGTEFASPETPFLFKQEVDLTMSLWINDRWFVEASFLDDSALNTYRAGYRGQPGEFLKYAGIGNTGLDFPVFPYLDLGGDSPSSFGFYSRFGTDELDMHALFRYDAASREERIFSGGRERTYSDLQTHNSVRGVSFVLPDTDINPDVTVYIEDEKGGILDNNGRRWRYALQSEFAVSRTQGLLELSIRPSAMAAVVYSKSGKNNPPWDDSLGSYDGTKKGYLTEVQNWFDKSRSQINLDDYAQPGEVVFGAQRALVIFKNGSFSPFERRSRYDAPSSSTERAALVDASTGTEVKGIDFVLLDNETLTDAFTFSAIVTHRGVYELVRSGNTDRRSPQSLWPLAQNFDKYQGEPEIYLSGKNTAQGNVILRFTNFSGISGFFIGTDAIPGSIQVWRSGIQDNNFNYNSASGEVVINSSVAQNELIRITYLKKDAGLNLGSVAAGLGGIYRGKGGFSPFSAQAAVGLRWNLTEDSFTEYDVSNSGTVGISAKTAWDYDNLKARITGGFAFVQTDATGLYRAAGMEGNEFYFFMPPELSYISNQPSSLIEPLLDTLTRRDLVFRNYNNSNILGSNLMNIDWAAPVISGINRPYPVKDSYLGDAHVLALEFNLQKGEWTGFQSPLDQGYNLSQAQEIEIPFRLYGFNKKPSPDFKIIVQIGSLSPRDFAFIENTDLIWENFLYSDESNFNFEPRIARFILNDKDRQKLAGANSIRVIAVCNDGDPVSGRILIASPIIRGASFRPVVYHAGINAANDSGTNRVTSVEIKEIDNALLNSHNEIIKKLHPEINTQRVLKIEWQNMEKGAGAGIDGRINEMPLSDYRELSFFVKTDSVQDAASLDFIIAQGAQNISNRQLDVKIPLGVFTKGKWSKVSVIYQGDKKTVMVDGKEAEGSRVSYNPLAPVNNTGANRSSYIAMLVTPDNQASSLADGVIFIDEIILEDPVLFYRVNAGAGIEYAKRGEIVKAGNVSVLSDFSVNTAVESEARFFDKEIEQSGTEASVVSRSGAEIHFFGARINGNFSFTAAEDTFLWNADHGIKKTIGAFNISEAFYVSPQENFAQHNFNIAFMSDFHAKFDADATYDFSKLRQKWNVGLGYKPKNNFIPMTALTSEAVWTKSEEFETNENYGRLWINSWEPLIPDEGSEAESRRTKTQFMITQRTKPVGAAVTLEGITGYTSVNNITRSENNAFLDIPVTLEKTNLNFRAGRNFKKHLYYNSYDALDDGKMFFESVEDSLALWKIFPGYSLFAQELNTALDESIYNSPSYGKDFYTFFSDYFNVRVSLPPLYNISSLFAPSSITFILERALEQKMDTRTDKLNLGANTLFSSINLFGAMGSSPLFKFYQTDEFSHALETAFIIPRNEEEVTWRVNSIISAGFRGFSGGMLNLVNNLNYRSEGYWTDSLNIGWEMPVKKSYLSVFYEWVSSSIAKNDSWTGLSNILNSNYEKLRKESFELVLDNSKDDLRWSLIAGHEDIIRILGRLNFTSFFKFRCSEDREFNIFIFDVLLGTTLRISF